MVESHPRSSGKYWLMKETPQEYTQRILSYLGGRDPLDIQVGTPGERERLIKEDQATRFQRVPPPGACHGRDDLENR